MTAILRWSSYPFENLCSDEWLVILAIQSNKMNSRRRKIKRFPNDSISVECLFVFVIFYICFFIFRINHLYVCVRSINHNLRASVSTWRIQIRWMNVRWNVAKWSKCPNDSNTAHIFCVYWMCRTVACRLWMLKAMLAAFIPQLGSWIMQIFIYYFFPFVANMQSFFICLHKWIPECWERERKREKKTFEDASHEKCRNIFHIAFGWRTKSICTLMRWSLH